MQEWLLGSGSGDVGRAVLVVVVTGVAIYLTTIAIARIGGSRTLASVSAFDFTANVAIGAMVGSVVVSPAIGIAHGVAGIVTLFSMQLVIGMLRERRRLRGLIDDTPVLVMRDGRVLEEALARTRLTEEDLQGAMRTQNVHRYADVDAIVLEKTGVLSVLHHARPTPGVDDRLLTGVKGRDAAGDRSSGEEAP